MNEQFIKQLKLQLIQAICKQDPEQGHQLFVVAALHGDVAAMDAIMDAMGDALDHETREQMDEVRLCVANIVEEVRQAEQDGDRIEAEAAQATQDLLARFKLHD
jgi:hypothetical protein